MSEDLISREKAYKVLSEYYHHKTEMQHKALQEALDRVPSAESEEFEWCTGCKEYDQEAHCCHRWTKVIRKTVEELKSAQPQWIPVTERLPMINTLALITTSKGVVVQVMYFGENMNGHKVWRSFGGEYVYWDEEVVAWMPLPDPWKGGAE